MREVGTLAARPRGCSPCSNLRGARSSQGDECELAQQWVGVRFRAGETSCVLESACASVPQRYPARTDVQIDGILTYNIPD